MSQKSGATFWYPWLTKTSSNPQGKSNIQERIMAPDRAYRAQQRGSSKFYDERRTQLPAWKPAGSWMKGGAVAVFERFFWL